MKPTTLKNILPLFIFCVSPLTYGYTSAIELDEHMSLQITTEDYHQQGIYSIWQPGADAWIENGKYHATKKMPACLTVLADSLAAKQLETFIDGLEVTTVAERKLSLEQYKGTWIFVDKNPWRSSFADTRYIVKPKNNLTFGQLLQSVGGTQYSQVSIEFSRGCAELAVRPYLPNPN